MDRNIIFNLSKDTIIISEIRKNVDYEILNNTNVIDLKELKFSYIYIRENMELVANFLNVVIIKEGITKVQINNMNNILLILDLINYWEHIKKIIFKQEKRINLDVFLKILSNPFLEEIECHSISPFLIERIDVNSGIKIITREKEISKSHFSDFNELNSLSDFYYKKHIIINREFDTVDIDEFNSFIKFNNKLKVIEMEHFSNISISVIVDAIKHYDKKNILIELYQNNKNNVDEIFNTINYIKKKDAKFLEENNIKFRLNYSEKYKKDYFFKEINYKLFTSIILFILVTSGIAVGIDCYDQYLDRKSINTQLNELNKIYNNAELQINIDDNENDVDYITSDPDVVITTKAAHYYPSSYYTNYSQVFDELFKINDNTVAWLTVNNTKINYPVVQSTDNEYYLNRDFNKKKNSMGWIFMDYRNDANELSKNTIIYGHNIKQGIMFGTIKNMLNPSWYKKPQNQIITFNTPTKKMSWQIFSLYKIDATEDYLNVAFDNDEEYLNFLNMIKSRSINDFGVNVDENSKILTLSTCFSHTTRHVIHAVLISEESNQLPTETVEEQPDLQGEITEQ